MESIVVGTFESGNAFFACSVSHRAICVPLKKKSTKNPGTLVTTSADTDHVIDQNGFQSLT